MSRRHKKKRNTGLMYEFLVKAISTGVVTSDKNLVNSAQKVLKEHFGQDTEISKEFRIFKALSQVNGVPDNVAATILSEARVLSNRCDMKKLDEEKTRLIQSIQRNLNEEKFYSQKLNDYKKFATIQTLLDQWRDIEKSDLALRAEYENKIFESMVAPAPVVENPFTKLEDVNDLVVEVMSRKINSLYTKSLTEDQKKLLTLYTVKGPCNELVEELKALKLEMPKLVKDYAEKSEDGVLKDKTGIVLEDIASLPTSETEINDTVMGRYLLISQLKNTLLEE